MFPPSLFSRLRRRGSVFALLGLLVVLMQGVALARVPAPATGGERIEVCTALGMITLDLAQALPGSGNSHDSSGAHHCCDDGAPGSVGLTAALALATQSLTPETPAPAAGKARAHGPQPYRAPPGRAPPRFA